MSDARHGAPDALESALDRAAEAVAVGTRRLEELAENGKGRPEVSLQPEHRPGRNLSPEPFSFRSQLRFGEHPRVRHGAGGAGHAGRQAPRPPAAR